MMAERNLEWKIISQCDIMLEVENKCTCKQEQTELQMSLYVSELLPSSCSAHLSTETILPLPYMKRYKVHMYITQHLQLSVYTDICGRVVGTRNMHFTAVSGMFLFYLWKNDICIIAYLFYCKEISFANHKGQIKELSYLLPAS
jgi:hypothetical protein